MPFQSEKQRRYLWANEPEIARDWTDTYGSRIQKNDGGIMRVGLRRGSGPGPGGQGARGQATQNPGVGGRNAPPGRGSGPHTGMHYTAPTPKTKTTTTRTGPHTDTGGYVPTVVEKKTKKERDKAFKKLKERAKTMGIKPKGHWTQRLGYGVLPNDPKLAYDFLNTLKDEDKETWESLPQELKDLLGVKPPGASGRTELDFDEWSMMTQVPGYGEFLKDRGKPGVEHSGNVGNLGDRFVKKDEFGNVIKDKYGNIKYGYMPNPTGGEGPKYYPGYVPGGTPQGGGGGTTATEVVEDTPSGFQESLTTSTSSPFDYYVGQDPTAKNLAWGQQFGVDPRTMGRTSWAADGGRIPAAFGGIMDTDTGRRAYGFGSIFKKVGRAAKKVLKSPLGKAALIGGLGFAANAGWLPGGFGSGWVGGLKTAAQNKPWLGKMLLNKDKGWSLGKLGIMGASALPFFMGGGDDDDDDSKFDYEGAKNAYAQELMRIKAGSMAGSLDPNKFNYLGVKDGGRIGLQDGGDPLLREEYDKYVFEMDEMGLEPMSFEKFAEQARAGLYAGGQSTPSDYTMEDAMMTTTQDKLGGITDVMKQADLNRQGSVGQFYAADGGRIGYAGGSGRPPITMGQVPQAPPQMPAPQVPQTPMPAPQPNRMRGMPGGMNPMMGGMPGGMNPMMNPMMRGMPGKRIGYADGTVCVPKKAYPWPKEERVTAQEGGLMDLGGMEKDYRNDGGFVPLGGEEKADDVPARLSKNEFVFTADAVRGAGDGDIDKGAEIMENIMKNLEQGGQISEETQGLSGAREMFDVSERLSEVV